MKIPLTDLTVQHKPLFNEINLAIKQVFLSSNFIKGPSLQKFETDLAKFIGVKYAVGVASGTDALHLSLKALNIGPDNEVILPVNTFIATAYAILYVRAKPIFVDIEDDSSNIDVNLIESKISKNTKAIIPVHLYGQPAKMQKVLAIAKKHHLKVIEDASQAQGALYKGKRVGSLGELGAFSLYPSKNLGACGDAGIITTNSKRLYQRLLALREYGGKNKYFYDEIGLNSRLDSLQAAILSVKLKYLDFWNSQRRKIASYYDQKLELLSPEVIPLQIMSDATPVYYCYVIKCKNRDKLSQYLQTRGIQTGIHYPIPLHLQKSLKHLKYKAGDFPVAEKTCKQILSLPMYPELDHKKQDYIIDAIKKFYEKN